MTKNYTTEQEQVINNIADKFDTNADRIKRQLNQMYESDDSISFEEATSSVVEVMHDHNLDMMIDAWDDDAREDYDE